MRALIIPVVTLFTISLPALAWAGGLSVHDAVIRASLGRTPNTAGYMTIMNDSARPARLVSARCGCAASVMIHQTETSNGVTVMAGAPKVIIPPHGMIRFRPGGLHLMIMGLKKPLLGGARQDMILIFDHGEPLTVRFSVQTQINEAPMGAMPGMSGG